VKATPPPPEKDDTLELTRSERAQSPIEPVTDYIAEKLEGSELQDYKAEVAKLDPTKQQAYELALSKVNPYDRNNYASARKTYGNKGFIQMVFRENERKEERAKKGLLSPLAYMIMGDIRRIPAMMTGQPPKPPSIEEVWGSFQEISVDNAVQALQKRRTSEFKMPFTPEELATIKRLETDFRLVYNRMYQTRQKTEADASALKQVIQEASEKQLVIPAILNNLNTGIEQQRMLYRSTAKRKPEEAEASTPATDGPSTAKNKKRRTHK
jgi:hypothetical protein